MGICQGKPVEMTSILGKNQQALQDQMIAQVMGQIGKGVPAYPGPVTSAPDPLQFMAANIMSNYATGKPYQAPPFLGAGGMAGIGGGGTGGDGGGGNKPYRDWSRPRERPMKEYGESGDERARRGYGAGPGWPTEPGVLPNQSPWPTGYDPLNDPNGWKRWLY